MEAWFQDLLQSAPPELKSGFFVSYLEFYDLQHSLQQGMISSLPSSSSSYSSSSSAIQWQEQWLRLPLLWLLPLLSSFWQHRCGHTHHHHHCHRQHFIIIIIITLVDICPHFGNTGANKLISYFLLRSVCDCSLSTLANFYSCLCNPFSSIRADKWAKTCVVRYIIIVLQNAVLSIFAIFTVFSIIGKYFQQE